MKEPAKLREFVSEAESKRFGSKQIVQKRSAHLIQGQNVRPCSASIDDFRRVQRAQQRAGQRLHRPQGIVRAQIGKAKRVKCPTVRLNGKNVPLISVEKTRTLPVKRTAVRSGEVALDNFQSGRLVGHKLPLWSFDFLSAGSCNRIYSRACVALFFERKRRYDHVEKHQSASDDAAGVSSESPNTSHTL
jgi:hypothetical protein